MKMLIITNSIETSVSLIRYMNYTMHKNRLYPYTFDDLRIISREILEMDFIISEVYRLEGNSIDDYGMDMFLSFVKREKKGILLHVDKIENLELGIQEFLFKIPGRMKELMQKIENLRGKERVFLSEEAIATLKKRFPYRVPKGHPRRNR